MNAFLRQLRPALFVLGIFTLITGLAYPLAMTGIGQGLFGHTANGSLIESDGRVVGSEVLGQSFSAPEYFHPRPSAAGDGYDAKASSGSNLGPTNQILLDAVDERSNLYRAANGLDPQVLVPVDAVTASGSGLDPHISIRNAQLQAPRVARQRNLSIETVHALIDQETDKRTLGILGDDGVNVLKLNIALDTVTHLQR